ncbi:hypothetical protein VM1G_11000 [Cytospora mali]|uniref:Uncharacterized protein n=1 Tax=Cytospora mali TaxID=578113 RepID=A0A194VJA2_CYTMA|nr:hypothetical protein VM1G_11000 [Valsa mali]
MVRNWHIVAARIADPFEPDWEGIEKKIRKMKADQDAAGGHKYPPFCPTDLVKKPSANTTSEAPAAYDFDQRPVLSSSPTCTPIASTGNADDDKVPQQLRKRRVPGSIMPVLKLDEAVMASKRRAANTERDGLSQLHMPKGPDVPLGLGGLRLDEPCGSKKRKFEHSNPDSEKGPQQPKRNMKSFSQGCDAGSMAWEADESNTMPNVFNGAVAMAEDNDMTDAAP